MRSLCPGKREFIRETIDFHAHLTGEEGLDEQRATYHAYSARYRQPRPHGVAVEDASFPPRHVPTVLRDVPIRIYRPPGISAGHLTPVVLYMHGGGWVLGSVDSHDCITAELADASGATIVSVDYRLAPEHPFPAGFEDCLAALRYLVDDGAEIGVDASRIVVAGDSAGANLAAALCFAARDVDGLRLLGQLLIYPVLGPDLDLPSHVENADAPMLKTEELRDYWKLYLPRSLAPDDPFAGTPYAAPLRAASFAGLAPAYVATAGHDPARDEGELYCRRLMAAGVPATYRCADDLAHGYLRARVMSRSAAAEFEGIIAGLRDLLE